MDIGKRLRELREANGLSQRDLEHRSGILCSYIYRVENGHLTPTLRLLESWAKALDHDLSQLFADGSDRPEARVSPKMTPVGAQKRTFLELCNQLSPKDRALLMSSARDMLNRKGKCG
jgi:transcriptional regulator with XRE-family HTH domain